MSSKKVPPVSFVFGSSTPRELSHHSDDCAKKGLKAKLEAGGDNAKRRGDILYYMRQAKSTDIKDSRNGGGVRARAAVAYAFGSSTPRSLSHMSKVPREQRVYDAKLAKQRTAAAADGLRVSATNPQLSGNRPKRWIGAGRRSVSVESQNDGDEAASEPDFVQDRMVDFSRNISSSSTKRAASGTPKKDSTTKTEDGRGRAKAKNSGAGTSVPPNNRKKISSSSSTTTTVQIQQQQKGRENGEEKWENGDGAVTATSVDEHQPAAEVQAVQQGQKNLMGMMEMNRNNNYGNGEEEEEENINSGEKEMGEEGRGGGQNEEKSRGAEEERQFDI